MIIGIEAERANQPQKTGVEHYAKQLILNLSKIDQQNHYQLYLRSLPQQWLKDLPLNFELKLMPFPIFWTQLRISWELFWHPVDALFIPASALPFVHPKKSVVTIHDLAWKYFPQSFTWFMRTFLDWSTKFAALRASNLIAVSEATKRDLMKFYQVNENKVVVIHHGYEVEKPERLNGRTVRVDEGEKYILFLSTLQPRKNLPGLIKAFRLLKTEHPELSHHLVVVGKPGWKFEGILKTIEANKDIVDYKNHVSEAEKADLLLRADALVLPSFYEGFGMQILEAFAAGVPVAASNVSSLPEVAGEAAIYFDPADTNQIKNAVKNLLMDKSLADDLRQKGAERLKEFSWEKCAKETLAVLKS